MNESQLTEQLKALHAANAAPDLGPGEFSRGMYAKSAGCKRSVAERELEQAQTAGLVKYVGERLHAGKWVKAYRFVTE